jgi:hypothetical protein
MSGAGLRDVVLDKWKYEVQERFKQGEDEIKRLLDLLAADGIVRFVSGDGDVQFGLGDAQFGLTEYGSALAREHSFGDDMDGIAQFVGFMLALRLRREALALSMRRRVR